MITFLQAKNYLFQKTNKNGKLHLQNVLTYKNIYFLNCICLSVCVHARMCILAFALCVFAASESVCATMCMFVRLCASTYACIFIKGESYWMHLYGFKPLTVMSCQRSIQNKSSMSSNIVSKTKLKENHIQVFLSKNIPHKMTRNLGALII